MDSILSVLMLIMALLFLIYFIRELTYDTFDIIAGRLANEEYRPLKIKVTNINIKRYKLKEIK